MSRNTDTQIAGFSYKIYINGKLLDDDRMKHINEVTLEDNSTGSDLLVIDIVDPDLKFLQDKVILEKSTIKFSSTYTNSKGSTSTINFEGYVAIIDVNFPSDGIPYLIINCMDKTFEMDGKPKKRTWEKVKRSDVASKIFKEYGFKTKIDNTSEKVDSITQSNETDIVFLTKLAEEEGYLVYLEGNTGYFVKKPSKVKSQATLKYKEAPYDIYSFSPRIVKTNKSKD